VIARAAAALACAAAACSSPREPTPAPVGAAPAAPSASPPTVPAGAPAMIDTLRDLARLFGGATLTEGDLTRRLGPPVGPPPPKGIATKLASNDPRFSRVRFATDVTTDAIYMLDLDLAEGARPTVAALRAAFGAPRNTSPSAIGAIPELRFATPDTATPFSVALLAHLAEGARGADGDLVMSVSLLREQRVQPGE
jgi:hypothetical protein